jgi:enamine deaminase RidA (YjgF/YER057c/UK114 family)
MTTTTSPEARLAEMGLSLPEPTSPVASYVPARRVGSFIYISGQVPLRNGELMAKGSVPNEVSPELA